VHCCSQLSRLQYYGNLEQHDALLDAKPEEADKSVSDLLGAPYPENEPGVITLSTVLFTECLKAFTA